MFELESRPTSINPWRSLLTQLRSRLRPVSQRARRKERDVTSRHVELLEDRTLMSASIALDPLKWTPIGPSPILNAQTPGQEHSSGRVVALVAHPTDPNTIYVAASGGGVWKTVDAGVSWAPKSDFQASLVMGAITLDPSNPNVIYAGTGESNNSGDSFAGRGVLKSTDGGNTWILLGGLPTYPGLGTFPGPGTGEFDGMAISSIQVKPGPDANNFLDDTIYVASSARVVNGTFVNAPGVWKSVNGGTSWTNTTDTSVNPRGIPNTGTGGFFFSNVSFSDLKMDPLDPETLYAGVTTFPTFFDPNDVSGLWKTTDGGNSWFRASDFPTGQFVGRVTVAIAPSNPNTIYASIAAARPFNFGALYLMMKSTNGGISWFNLPNTPNYMGTFPYNNLVGQGHYDTTLIVDRLNENIVYAGGQENLIKTDDGGVNWANISVGADGRGPHVDHHAIGFDAAGRLIIGSDGGVWRLDSAAAAPINWTNLNGTPGSGALNTVEFNGISLDRFNPNLAIGGNQDNGTVKFNDNLGWQHIRSGDGGFTLIDFSEPNRIYHEYQNGQIERSDDGGASWVSIDNGINLTNAGFSQVEFYTRFYMDPGNSKRLYRVTDQVWESNDYGTTWTAINTIPAPDRPATVNPGGGGNAPRGWVTKNTITSLGISTSHDIVWAATSRTYSAPFDANDAGFDSFWRHPRLFISDGRQVASNDPNFVGPAFWYDITPALAAAGVPVDFNGYPIFPIEDIRVDPQNPLVAYVHYSQLTGAGQIYRVQVDPSSGFGFGFLNWTTQTGPNGVTFFGSTQATAVDMTGDLPAVAINAIDLDPRQFGVPDDILFVGTDAGIYATRNFTPTQKFFNWKKYGTGLPNVHVTDIELSKNLNILAVGTYGRGMWEIIENANPTLSRVNNLTGAFEDLPFTITYDMLLTASDAKDPHGDKLAFRLGTLTSGTLLKRQQGGQLIPVVPGSTRLESGESWVWQGPKDANGVLAAFTVVAFDLELASAPPIQVSIDTAPTNDPPTLSTMATLSGASINTPFNISYNRMLSASNAVDPDGDTVVFRVQAINNGTLTKNGQPVVIGTTQLGPIDTWVWTAPLNFTGTSTAFTVVAVDPSNAASSPPVQVFISTSNPPPNLSSGTLNGGTEDTPFTVTYNALVTAMGATDADGEPVTFRLDAVTSGSLTKGGVAVTPGQTSLSNGESWVWTPAANANGALPAFTVTAFDASGANPNPAQVTVNVAAVNDPPVLNSITPLPNAPKGFPFSITFGLLQSASDLSDPDGGATLSFRVESVTSGTLTKNGAAVVAGTTLFGQGEVLVWTPPNNGTGIFAAFTVSGFDGVLSSGFPVQVNVNVVNNPPTLTTVNTLPGGTEDVPFSISYASLKANSDLSDVNGDPLSFRVAQVLSGTLTKNGQPVAPGITLLSTGETWIWLPPANANGAVPAFTVRGWDGQLPSSTPVGVSIDLAPVPDPPTLTTVSPLTGAARNQPFDISYFQLLAASDAVDPDGDTVSFQVQSITSGTLTKNGVPVVQGSTLLQAGEDLVWTPPSGAPNTAPAFTVVAFDGGLYSSTNVQVSVAIADTPPTLTKISLLTGVLQGDSLNITYATLLGASNAADADGTPVSFRLEAVSNGTLTKNGAPVTAGVTLLSSGETWNWRPSPTARNTVPAFTVRAWDGELASANAVQVNVFVTPVNHAPTLSSVSTILGGIAGQPVNITYDAVRSASDAADSDGDPISFRIATVNNGTVTKNGAPVAPGSTLSSGESVTWTPAAGTGSFATAFTVQAFDGIETSVVPVGVNVDVSAVRLYRAYNPNAAYHFFTTNVFEFQSAVQHGYQDESTGRAGFAIEGNPVNGTSALHRLRNPNTGKHYYTPNDGERDFLVARGWKFEKDEGYIFNTQVPNSAEIFKLYNRISGTHLYTDNSGTRDTILRQFPGVWVINTSLGFGFSVPATGTIPTGGSTSDQRTGSATNGAVVASASAPSVSLAATSADSTVSRMGVDSGLAAGTTSSAAPLAVREDDPQSNATAASAGSAETNGTATVQPLDEFWSGVGRDLHEGAAHDSALDGVL